MSVSAIRSAIVANLLAVADIGRVHAYQRYAVNLRDLAALYRSDAHQQLRGWYVTRLAMAETNNIQARTVEVIRWRIFGAMALADGDSSELIFDDLLEAVRDRFASDESLGGSVDQCSEPGGDGETGLQIDEQGPATFADVLCHTARCSLLTVRYLDRSTP